MYCVSPVWRKHVVYAWLPPEGKKGMGMPPLRTALLRQTGGNLHALQPAGGVLKKAADQSGVFHLCRLDDTDKSVTVFFLGSFPS